MSNFIPRSIGAGSGTGRGGEPRSGWQNRDEHSHRGRARGTRGYGVRGRVRANPAYRPIDNKSGRSRPPNQRNFHNRGRGFSRGRGGYNIPSPPDKGPVSIIFPDDPRHPDYETDPRNANLITRRGKRRDRDDVRSDDEDSAVESEHEIMTKEEDVGNMSDEGLRITVENKASSMSIADPSFYDEIQPRQSSTDQQPEKEMKSADAQHSTHTKKQSKKAGKESIRITVGNDRFTDDSKEKSSASPTRDEPPDKQSVDKNQNDDRNRAQEKSGSRDRSLAKDKQRGSKPPVQSHSRDRHRKSRSRSRDRRRSRSRSRGSFRRSRSRERYQDRNQSRYRSRSRSRDRYRNEGRNQGRNPGPYRSRSRERYRSRSPQRHSGPIRGHSSGLYRGRSRSRSLDRHSNSRNRNSRSPDRANSPSQHRAWSRESFSSISDGSLNASGKTPTSTTATKPKPNSQNGNSEGSRQTSNKTSKPKDNPFMDFLNELDYPKLNEAHTTKKSPKVEEPSRTPPWLKDSAKGSDISEIEKYLESKLKEVRTTQEAKQKAQPQAQHYPDHPGQMMQASYRDMPTSTVTGKSSSSWHEQTLQAESHDQVNYQITKSSKESTPFDMYDDLPRTEPIRQKMASPPPLETKPVRSILKKKAIEPQQNTEPLPYAMSGRPRDQTPHSDTCSITDRAEMCLGGSQPQDTAVPGMASLMNIDDEDEFLYGGGSESTTQPVTSMVQASNNTKPEVASSNLDDSIYRGGYSGNTADPGWEVAEPSDRFAGDENIDKSPVKVEEPKTESDKLSADPTIQNILKSIGFNFELSKLMQEKAEKTRKTDEDIESYGIKQGSSFLGGGMSGADMQSALATESGSASDTGDKKARELRKPSTDKKESYEERARRYREDQLKQSSAHLKDSYEESNYNQQDPYSSQDYMERQPQQSAGYYDSQYPQQDYDMSENQSSNYPYSASSDMTALTQSNLPTIQTVDADFDRDKQGSRGQALSTSALHSLQSQYDEPDKYQDHDERQRYRRRSPGVQNQRPFNEKGDYDARVQPPQTHETQYDRASSFDRQSAPRKPDTSQDKPLFPIIRERSSSGSSRRTVIPPKRESRESPAPEVRTIRSRGSLEVQSRESPVKEVRKFRESPVKEVRKIQSKPIEKPVKLEPEHKPIKKVSKMSSKEREELVQEINERAKRLKLLEKELSRLRKQENELMRKKQRQKDGHKDQLLDQNSQLQKEIGQQIKVLRRAAEVNAKLLAASRRDDEAEVDFLALFKESSASRDTESSEIKQKLLSRSQSPSPTTSSNKPPKVHGKSPEPQKGYKSKMKFEYFDSGNHWCKQCNHVSTNVYEFFGHLQSKKHQQKLDPYDRPWMPESLKNPSKGSTGQTIAAAFKGVEFMMSTQSFYCSLCKVFSGDMTCAEDHMKSTEHNDKYQGYLDENPFYERRYNLDKAAGLSMGSVSREQASDEEKERDMDKVAIKLKQERKESRRKQQEQEEEIKYRSQRSKRYVDYDESERNLVLKKAKIAEERKRETGQRKRDVSPRDQEQSRKEEVHDDSEPVIRRTISAVPKVPEHRTVPFGKFSWKSGPMIGKAPGYKKAAASSSDPTGEKISIKLGGRMPHAVKAAPPPQPTKVVMPVQDVEDPAKDPEYQLRKKQFKKEDQLIGPAPLDIFLTVGKNSADQGISIPTVDNNSAPVKKQNLSPTAIADAFSGKNDEEESEDTMQIPSIPIPVPATTREEEQEMKMLGIQHSDTVTVPVKPTQLALQPSIKPASSMASSSAENIYNVFFGSKDGDNESSEKNEVKESKENEEA